MPLAFRNEFLQHNRLCSLGRIESYYKEVLEKDKEQPYNLLERIITRYPIS